MERSRQRKSKSSPANEGYRQLRKQKSVSKSYSDSRSYNDGNTWDNKFKYDMGQSSSARPNGTPIRKLVAEEMTTEAEYKRRFSSLIARLIGMERIHSKWHLSRQPKGFSSYQHKQVPVDIQRNSQLYDNGHLIRRRSFYHQQPMDVYGNREPPHDVNRRLSSKWSVNSMLTKHEMALIQRRFDSRAPVKRIDSNKDICLEYLRRPDSLLMKHVNDLHVDPTSYRGSHLANLRSSNSAIYEAESKAWNPELRRKDGLLLESQNRHRAHVSSRNASKTQQVEKIIEPTRITVLKPHHRKMRDSGISGSSSSHEQPYSLGYSKPISEEAKKIAIKITRRMRYGYEGYAGDESSYDASESDPDSESEGSDFWYMKYLEGSNSRNKHPSITLGEAENKEAKQRHSERWRATPRYQDLEMVGEGLTLGEMLSLPDKEPRHVQLNLGRASNSFGRDGWKEGTSRTSSRSRSLLPSTGETSHRRSSYHDDVDPTRHGKSKAIDFSSKDSKSRGKKPLPYQHVFNKDRDPELEANFELQMEAQVKDLSFQLPKFQMDAKNKGPAFDENRSTISSKSSELESSSVDDKYTVHDQEDSGDQVLHKGPPEQDSPSLEGSKEVNRSSPVSVLEVPLTEETSANSESFERVGAALRELQMQVNLLKMEQDSNPEAPPALAPIEEEVAELSPTGVNYILGTQGWETCYTLDALLDSGLDSSSFDIYSVMSHSPNDSLLDHKVFDNLENQYSDKTNGLRSERMLLFDRVNLALCEMYQEHVDLFPWVMPKLVKGFSCKGEKEWVRIALEKLINQECEIPEKVLDREMQWKDSKGEIDAIGNEIENLLIDEMIVEVLSCE
ncbi:hypothetical protein ACJIZ3_021996 [Penstemon smallii]|uniref:DUF4378 domain-containing protein n=1 Tax=Penstemon smallii TaxID=265156 RepID=A0ABD3SNX3_9LAMI